MPSEPSAPPHKSSRKPRVFLGVSVMVLVRTLLVLLAGVGLFRLTGSGDPDVPGIRVQLLDSQQNPVACTSTLWFEDAGRSQAGEDSSRLCEQGELVWTDLEAGSYRLVAQAPGKERFERRVQVDFAAIDLGVVVVSDGMRVEGQVVMAEEPVGDALILVEGGRRVQSGPDGRFALDGLPAQDLEFRAAAEGGRGAARFEISKAGEEVFQIQLERGRGQGLLGLRFESRTRGPVVTDLLSGTPASQELERGDLLLEVDGVALLQLAKQEVAQVLAGEVGSVAALKIERAGVVRDVSLKRVAPQTLIDVPPSSAEEVVD